MLNDQVTDQVHTYTAEIGGKTIIIESGRFARTGRGVGDGADWRYARVLQRDHEQSPP